LQVIPGPNSGSRPTTNETKPDGLLCHPSNAAEYNR
jgi:hypothetical protein